MDSAPTTEFRVSSNRLGTPKHHSDNNVLFYFLLKLKSDIISNVLKSNYSLTSKIGKYILFKKRPTTQEYLVLLLNCID